jgi:hypothetical protein
MEKIIAKGILGGFLLVSSISLVRVYTRSYIADVHLAHSLPLAIIVAATMIAIAIIEKDR